MLEEEGVQLVGARCPRTPITAVMPVGPERAMVTYDPGIRARAADVASLAPRAVITGLSQLDVVPAGARAYVSVGDDDARAFAGRLPGAASRATGLFIEQREALVLTGAASAAEAAEMIGARVPIVVVSLGAEGAAACIDGRVVHVDGYDVGPSIDTTGAGDLFVAAWAWGERSGWTSTTRCSGPRCTRRCRCGSRPARAARPGSAEFVEEGSRRGLPAPPRARRARRLRRAGASIVLALVARLWRLEPDAARRRHRRHGDGRRRPPRRLASRSSATGCATRVVGRVGPPAGELSGLVRSSAGGFWAHNDSGDAPRIFALGA